MDSTSGRLPAADAARQPSACARVASPAPSRGEPAKRLPGTRQPRSGKLGSLDPAKSLTNFADFVKKNEVERHAVGSVWSESASIKEAFRRC